MRVCGVLFLALVLMGGAMSGCESDGDSGTDSIGGGGGGGDSRCSAVCSTLAIRCASDGWGSESTASCLDSCNEEIGSMPAADVSRVMSCVDETQSCEDAQACLPDNE